MKWLKWAVCGLVLTPIGASGVQQSADEVELLRIHETILDSHRQGDVERWMELEADDYVSVNRGRVTFPTSDARRQMRTPYFASTTFTMYRDLRAPVVRVSGDGSMGWLAAEVEVRGVERAPGGEESTIQAIWAWVELYEKGPNGWRVVGNASNPREQETGG
jgi:ketosteroid isomerase-like protein